MQCNIEKNGIELMVHQCKSDAVHVLINRPVTVGDINQSDRYQ